MEKKELLEVDFGSGKLKAKISKNTAVKLMYGADVRLRDFAYETCIRHILKHGEGLITLDEFPVQQHLYQVLGNMLKKDRDNQTLAQYLRLINSQLNKPETEMKMANVLLQQQPDNDEAVKVLCGLLQKAQTPDIDRITPCLINYYHKVSSPQSRTKLLELLKGLLERFPLAEKETLFLLSTFCPESAEF